jgi:hypothetical protein
MTDRRAPVTPIRPRVTARYGDTEAVDDILALLTGRGGLGADAVVASVGEIVARTGRRLDRARIITAEVSQDGGAVPVAVVDADGTVVLVSQDPDGPGVLIQVTTRDHEEAAGLVVTIDGRTADRALGPGPIAPAGVTRPGERNPRLPGTTAGEGDCT